MTTLLRSIQLPSGLNRGAEQINYFSSERFGCWYLDVQHAPDR